MMHSHDCMLFNIYLARLVLILVVMDDALAQNLVVRGINVVSLS